jgi:hypothetical protein
MTHFLHQGEDVNTVMDNERKLKMRKRKEERREYSNNYSAN